MIEKKNGFLKLTTIGEYPLWRETEAWVRMSSIDSVVEGFFNEHMPAPAYSAVTSSGSTVLVKETVKEIMSCISPSKNLNV